MEKKSFIRKLGSLSLVSKLLIVIVVLAVMQYKYVFVPAVVNNQPIFSWSYIARLHELGGPTVMDGLIRERLVRQAAKESGIEVSDEELNVEIDKWAERFEESGGFESWLSDQGLMRKDFEEQITLNLIIERLVEDLVEVTDEEVEESDA